jgi:hypothetical protein
LANRDAREETIDVIVDKPLARHNVYSFDQRRGRVWLAEVREVTRGSPWEDRRRVCNAVPDLALALFLPEGTPVSGRVPRPLGDNEAVCQALRRALHDPKAIVREAAKVALVGTGAPVEHETGAAP